VVPNGPANAVRADTTRHSFSILIFQGFNPVEQMVSPAEAGNIEVYKDYQFDEPQGATAKGTQASLALWDPRFRAVPNDQTVGAAGGFSYAHTIPLALRKTQWGNTFAGNQVVLANRGPTYQQPNPIDTGPWVLQADAPGTSPSATYNTPLGTASNTLLIHGGRTTWEGNIVLNDNSSKFSSEPDPQEVIFTFQSLSAQNRNKPDNIFMNENDAGRTINSAAQSTLGGSNENFRNAYLRSYAGGNPEVGAGTGITLGGSGANQTWTIQIFHD
jgi:hypothetical protein